MARRCEKATEESWTISGAPTALLCFRRIFLPVRRFEMRELYQLLCELKDYLSASTSIHIASFYLLKSYLAAGDYVPPSFDADEQSFQKAALDDLDDAIHAAGLDCKRVTKSVRDGGMPDVVGEARGVRADLVLLATRTWTEGVWLPSNVRYLSRNADCAVLVFRSSSTDRNNRGSLRRLGQLRLEVNCEAMARPSSLAQPNNWAHVFANRFSPR